MRSRRRRRSSRWRRWSTRVGRGGGRGGGEGAAGERGRERAVEERNEERIEEGEEEGSRRRSEAATAIGKVGERKRSRTKRGKNGVGSEMVARRGGKGERV